MRRAIRALRDNRGLTLVEMLMAMVLLTAVTLAIMGLYSSLMGSIISSGKRTDAIYSAQTLVSSSLAAGTESDSDTLLLSFPGVPNIEVEGFIDQQSVSFGRGTVTITAFIPR